MRFNLQDYRKQWKSENCYKQKEPKNARLLNKRWHSVWELYVFPY